MEIECLNARVAVLVVYTNCGMFQPEANRDQIFFENAKKNVKELWFQNILPKLL